MDVPCNRLRTLLLTAAAESLVEQRIALLANSWTSSGEKVSPKIREIRSPSQRYCGGIGQMSLTVLDPSPSSSSHLKENDFERVSNGFVLEITVESRRCQCAY